MSRFHLLDGLFSALGGFGDLLVQELLLLLSQGQLAFVLDLIVEIVVLDLLLQLPLILHLVVDLVLLLGPNLNCRTSGA